jgi:hypothetical protein
MITFTMASPEEILKQVNKVIEYAAEKFNNSLPSMQKRVFEELKLMLKDLDVKSDKIRPSVKNLKLISSINKKLEKIIFNKTYKAELKDYVSAFNEISSLQNQYFFSIEDEFKPSALLQQIREQAIDFTIDGMNDAVKGTFGPAIRTILQQNITGGGSYKELMESVSMQITDEQYLKSSKLKTLTITSVAQYARNYSHTVAEGLSFEWYQYVGSTIDTTRCFCHAMVKKRFFHKSEVPDLLSGDFKEFEDRDCGLNSKTGLPDGMIDGTNESNFFTLAGGWNCQHSIFPVPASRVPEGIRSKFQKAN